MYLKSFKFYLILLFFLSNFIYSHDCLSPKSTYTNNLLSFKWSKSEKQFLKDKMKYKVSPKAPFLIGVEHNGIMSDIEKQRLLKVLKERNLSRIGIELHTGRHRQGLYFVDLFMFLKDNNYEVIPIDDQKLCLGNSICAYLGDLYSDIYILNPEWMDMSFSYKRSFLDNLKNAFDDFLNSRQDIFTEISKDFRNITIFPFKKYYKQIVSGNTNEASNIANYLKNIFLKYAIQRSFKMLYNAQENNADIMIIGKFHVPHILALFKSPQQGLYFSQDKNLSHTWSSKNLIPDQINIAA